jgi:hypothetical protein
VYIPQLRLTFVVEVVKPGKLPISRFLLKYGQGEMYDPVKM